VLYSRKILHKYLREALIPASENGEFRENFKLIFFTTGTVSAGIPKVSSSVPVAIKIGLLSAIN
jgi:hypothetical protein